MLHNVYKVLKQGGLFFVEVRSVNDELYGQGKKVGKNAYIFDGHFRRFVELDQLVKKMERVGFVICSAMEERGFAPFGDSDPLIIRIIAER